MRLGVDPKTAARDACRVEHVIDDRVVDRIEALTEAWGSLMALRGGQPTEQPREGGASHDA